MNDCSKIKISIIVPVFNVEKHIEHCMESLTGQTLAEIEIICVDDFSTDLSGKILDAYAESDPRIRVLHLEKNMGTLCARQKGLDAASGRFLMFVDSDDALDVHACEKLYQCITENDVDAVHFGTQLHAAANVSEDMVSWVRNFLTPHHGLLEGNLNRACFIEEKFDFNITNKIWRRQVCEQAAESMEMRRLTASEDRYFFFLLMYFSKRYFGISDRFYHYNLGIGVTGGDQLSLAQFEKRCSGAQASAMVRRFLRQAGDDSAEYQEIAGQFEKKILWDCVDCWHNKLAPENQPEGFEILSAYFEPHQTAGAFARVYFEQGRDIFSRIRMTGRKQAVIYHRYLGSSAADEETAAWIKRLKICGYGVLLYTDVQQKGHFGEEEYGVPIVYLPDSYSANWDKYEIRALHFYKQLQKDKADILLYMSPSSHIAWLDILLGRLAGVDVFAMQEELYVNRIRKLEEDYAYLEAEYRRMEEQFQHPFILLRRFLGSIKRKVMELWKQKGTNTDGN